MSMTDSRPPILRLAAQIVTAHVRHNEVAMDSIPSLIKSVYDALYDVGGNLARGSTSATVEHAHHDHSGHDHHTNHNGHDHQHFGHNGQDQIASNAYVHPSYGQTVYPDRLICMEDGLSMKMLKRHLLTVHGMTPDEYRAKWGLPEAYPMVAETYAKLRSSLALQSGLGLKPEARNGRQRKSR